MKNGSLADFPADANISGLDNVISQNLDYISRLEASVYERKFAHLRDRAGIIAASLKKRSGYSDIMDAVAFYDLSAEIYDSFNGGKSRFPEFFDAVNFKEASYLSEYSRMFEKFYLCKSISSSCGLSYEPCDIVRWLSGGADIIRMRDAKKDTRVAFVRGNQSNRAFEKFARFVPGVMAEYEDDFKSACETVADGGADFAIIPLENTFDGRLNSFYRLLDKYALPIVLSADIASEDTDNSTRFALIYKSFGIINAPGELIFECRITFSEQKDLGNIISAADYFRADVKKIYSLPFSSGGRENSFGIIFGLDGADFAGFFCYLMLEYPQFSPIGIYTLISQEER
ncbi:MAG: hypothetical protein ACI4QR_00205 [Eubacteriales bacterium]